MKRFIILALIAVLTSGCAHAHELEGKWVLINGEESVDETQFIQIDKDGNALLVYDSFEAIGTIEKTDYGWIFHSNIAEYELDTVASIDPYKNGALAIFLANEYTEITIGYFKKMKVQRRNDNQRTSAETFTPSLRKNPLLCNGQPSAIMASGLNGIFVICSSPSLVSCSFVGTSTLNNWADQGYLNFYYNINPVFRSLGIPYDPPNN